jgi:hypothetical protein
MVAMTRIFEGLICMAFYAGICYLLLDGAGEAALATQEGSSRSA